jgi:hypothetical protein
MKTVEIHLAYFKQGDDMHYYAENTKTPIDAFEQHSQNMIQVSEQLKGIADILRKNHHRMKDVSIDADTHMIFLNCPDDIADELVEAQLASFPEWMDEEEEEEEEIGED